MAFPTKFCGIFSSLLAKNEGSYILIWCRIAKGVWIRRWHFGDSSPSPNIACPRVYLKEQYRPPAQISSSLLCFSLLKDQAFPNPILTANRNLMAKCSTCLALALEHGPIEHRKQGAHLYSASTAWPSHCLLRIQRYHQSIQ